MPLQHNEDDHANGVAGSLEDWRQPEVVEAREQRQAEAKAKRRETRFGRVSYAALRAQKAKAPDFVIDDWMVAREVSFFAGESEAGKTFLAIDIAFRVALGWPVFGRRVKKGLVVYQIGESGESLKSLRIPAWLDYFGKDLAEDVPLEVLQSRVNMVTTDPRAEDGAHKFLEVIKNISAEHGIPVSLIVIDTWSKAFVGGNENDARDVSRFIANAEMLAKATGAHVAIIHHFPKGAASLRGHSSLRADVDSVAMVRTDPNTKIRTIRLDKLKDGEKADMQFELKQVRLGERDGDGKPITSCVVLPVGEKAREREAPDKVINITRGENTFLRAFFAALDKDGSLPPAGFECPADAKVVDYEKVRAAFYEMNPPQEVDSGLDEDAREQVARRHKETTRKALRRASEDLARKIAIGIKLHTAADGKEVHLAGGNGRPIRGFARTYPPEQKRPQDNVDAVVAAEGGDWMDQVM